MPCPLLIPVSRPPEHKPKLAQKRFHAYTILMTKLLVLGVGNMLLTDDGVGVFAAQTLQNEEWPENVRILDAGTFTQDIFYLFEGYDLVLVLDIVHCGGKPGTIYRLTEDELVKNEEQRLSLHDIDLIDSLNMAEILHKKRPRLLVLGMEPEDFTSWNIGLSHAVQERFEDFLTAARREIRALAG
jgi:hydrogenase maturation protease